MLPGNRVYRRQVGWRFWPRLLAWRLRRFANATTVRLPTGLPVRLPPGNPFASEVYVTRFNVDWGGEAVLLELLDRRRDFVDVGANFGYYSLLAAPLVRQVYAVEPDPRNLDDLRVNVSRAPNVRVVPAALSSTPGEGFLDTHANLAVSRLAPSGTSVSVRTLDTLRDDGADPAAIKIDTEGSDLDVIRGGLDLIGECQPLIFVEFPLPASGEDVFDLVARLDGYSVFAHTRPLAAQSARPSLSELSSAASGVLTKMLFLVPRRLRSEFFRRSGA